MKKYYKYLGVCLLSLGILSCDNETVYPTIEADVAETVALNTGDLDFSKYVAVGASFTAGFTDNALFIAAQENSFPNILANKFGTDFNQPLMEDNIGGLLYGGHPIESQGPRLYFNGSGPTGLNATQTTEVTTVLSGSFNNYGIPGAKSFHFVAEEYGALAEVPKLKANPYYARMASSQTSTVLEDALAQNPTFFTLSEIGGNDVLGFAVNGGFNPEIEENDFVEAVSASNAIYQSDNTVSPEDYGTNDITNVDVFASVFSTMVTALTANGAKGVVANVPYITNLAHFTTVPYNPLDPTEDTPESQALAGQIPLLNSIYGAINQIYTGAGEPERSIVFSETATNPVVIFDEDATDLTVAIATTLGSSPTFVPFVESLGLTAQAAPLVAGLLGQQFGKARSATANDLLVLPSSAVIGKVNTDVAAALITQSGGLLPQNLAGQFSAEGVTLPLEDKWVLTPQEQAAIKTATDAYNMTIEAVANTNDDVAFVDFKALLEEATNTGVQFDSYTLSTSLVTGGLISLDGVHLTGRGYALMANEILEVIDAKWGSNFTLATDGLAKADNHPTNYSPSLQ